MMDIEKVRELAKEAYGDIKRKDGGLLWDHARRVASAVATHGYEYMALAYMHDVLEDTGVNREVIEEALDWDIWVALRAVTRCEGEDYTNYILRLIKNPMAVIVKRADIIDNLSDNGGVRGSLMDKYRLALHILGS